MSSPSKNNSSRPMIAMSIVLLLAAGGSWFFYKKMSSVAVDSVVIAPATMPSRGGAGAAANSSPGTIRRAGNGIWTATARAISMVASPAQAPKFAYAYSYVNPQGSFTTADRNSYQRLRTEVMGANSATLTPAQIAKLKPLFEIKPSIPLAMKAALEMEFEAIAAESVDKPQTDAKIVADEHTFLVNLMNAGRNAQTVDEMVLASNLAQMKQILGADGWRTMGSARASAAARIVPANVSRRTTTTQPVLTRLRTSIGNVINPVRPPDARHSAIRLRG